MDVTLDISSARLTLAGRLDVRTARQAREALHRVLELGLAAGRDPVVDLTAVHVADGSGLGVLVGAHRRAESAGLRLVFRSCPPRLLSLLGLLRLHRVLHLEPAPALAAS